MADRVDLVTGILPPGVPDAARTIALALGLGLVWLSRGLARRKRRAWWLAVAVVFASAVAHLAKGLDFEESVTHILLLVALVRARRHFVAPGDPATIKPLVQVGAALTVCVPVALVYAYDHDAFSERIEEALLIVIGGLARPGAVALVPAASRRAAGELRPRARGRARAAARQRQPGVLRAPPRQELLLLGERPHVPRLPRDRRHRARRRRPDRRTARAARPDGRVPASRSREGLARRDRRRVERGARGLRRPRLQVDLPRRRGGDPPERVLARRPADPQGPPVGLAAAEGRLPGSRALDRRLRRRAARGAPRRLAGVARQLARARLHDGDGRALSLSRHGAGGRRRARPARSAASCSSSPRRRARATRSRRCGGAATRRTA